MQDFRFSNEHSPTEVSGIVDVLRRPRLYIPTAKDYPNHNDWLEKVEAQMASGSKRAMAAYMGKGAVGAVVYQRMPGNARILEVRNISVADSARGASCWVIFTAQR